MIEKDCCRVGVLPLVTIKNIEGSETVLNNGANKFGQLDRFSARHLSIMAMLMAMRIAMSFIPAVKIGNIIQMGFGFIGTGIVASILGPFYMIIFAIAYDLIDVFIVNPGFPFFPGFLLSAILAGFIYARFFWRKEPTWKRVILATLIVTVFINIGLNTIWLKIMYKEAWRALIIPRLIKNAISFPLNSVVLYFVLNTRSIKRVINQYQF